MRTPIAQQFQRALVALLTLMALIPGTSLPHASENTDPENSEAQYAYGENIG